MNDGVLWLASYPKSGNTWLRAVIGAWLSGEPARLDALMADSIAARGDFDDAIGIPSSDLTPGEVAALRPRVVEQLVAATEGPLVRKIHDGLYPGPNGEPVVPAAATRGAIYIVRDPRDVAVSLGHHFARPVEWAVDRLADDGYELASSNHSPAAQLAQRLGTWSRHVTSWVDDPPFPAHVMTYEDCVEDPVRAFGAALRFSGLGDVSDGDVVRAVEGARFERLREEEAAHGFRERAVGAPFFRRGRPGAWRDEMSPEAAARIEATHGEVMVRFGYA